jgi:hypothetical protein
MFLEDPDLALVHHEKMFVYALTGLLASSSAHKVPTKNEGPALDASAEHGIYLLNLLPTIIIHMRLHKTLPTWVVYSLQMMADYQELIEDHELHRAFFEMNIPTSG